jgi:hypothetical protein
MDDRADLAILVGTLFTALACRIAYVLSDFAVFAVCIVSDAVIAEILLKIYRARVDSPIRPRLRASSFGMRIAIGFRLGVGIPELPSLWLSAQVTATLVYGHVAKRWARAARHGARPH